MKSFKKACAATLAVLMAMSFAACGSSSSDSETDSSSRTKTEDEVKVISTDDIEAIPEGSESTLLYMGIADLNPTGNDDKSVGLTLFEEKGGTIEYSKVTSVTQYTKLGAAVTAGKDVPDLFGTNGPMFPCQIVQGFFQPVDDVVDFDSSLWSGVKDTADQYVLNGKHYVAPISFKANAFIWYDKDVITEEGLDDPMELYDAGEWDYDAMDDLMEAYVNAASGDEERYGINGWYGPSYVQQTGETMVTTEDHITYTNNLNSDKIASAMNRLENWRKNGWVLEGWIGECGECINKNNCLFYAMGEWAATVDEYDGYGPSESDNWGVVPFPSDPNYDGDLPITSTKMTAYSWVAGSTKTDAVRCFYECYRIAETDETYAQNTKDKWLVDNPNWDEETYEILRDAVNPETHLMIFDPSYGVSSLMGDDFSGFRSGVCLTNWLYKSTSATDEDGSTYTWTQAKEMMSDTVDGELKTLNEAIQKFIDDGTTTDLDED